jgi:hypothetical protein
MNVPSEKAMILYAEAYQKLYKRMPKDLRALDNNWVVVNGARMRVSELEYLTKQLQQEYTQSLDDRRGLVTRLLKWFKQ